MGLFYELRDSDIPRRDLRRIIAAEYEPGAYRIAAAIELRRRLQRDARCRELRKAWRAERAA